MIREEQATSCIHQHRVVSQHLPKNSSLEFESQSVKDTIG